MFEKEAGFAETKMLIKCNGDYSKKQDYKKGWQDGAEFGYEQGIGRLRYCCTCKNWKECKVESMYGICAEWEIKE